MRHELIQPKVHCEQMWRQAKNKAERYKTEWTCVDEVQTHANPKRKKKSNIIEMKWKMSGVNERDR